MSYESRFIKYAFEQKSIGGNIGRIATQSIFSSADAKIKQQQKEIEALKSKIVTLGCDVLREADKLNKDLYEPRSWLALSVKNAQKLTKANN